MRELLRRLLVAEGASRQAGVRNLFLRGLGVVYLGAFSSLAVQARGLFGEGGILPAGESLASAHRFLGGAAFLQLPSLFWLGSSDGTLLAFALAGIAASVGLVLLVAPGPTLLFLWALYLSFVTAGGIFFGYQWDNLLLETGFLALFVAQWRLTPKAALGAPPPPPLGMFLLRLLLFRLMFFSGVVKLASGDPSWQDGTALTFHYWTQPLPSFTSPFLDALPRWFHQLSTALTVLAELLLPWCAFGPRAVRRVAGVGLIVLQLLLAWTGNYGFFNLLSAVLAIPLFADDDLRRVLPRWITGAALPAGEVAKPPRLGPLYVAAATLMLLLGVATALNGIGVSAPSSLLRAPLQRMAALRSVSSYGLFAVMTKERLEIEVEGSSDGVTWRPYVFRHKPGPLERGPSMIFLHLPRLDWQMWFAALGNCGSNPWFLAFQQRLLEGKPAVTELLESSPFSPAAPPRYVRSTTRPYRFAQGEARSRGLHWTTTGEKAEYCPTLTLVNGELAAVRGL